MINYAKVPERGLYFALLIFSLVGCTTIPDQPYHQVCKGDEICTEEEYSTAVSAPKKSTFINKYGRGATHNPDESANNLKVSRSDYRETNYKKAYLEFCENGLPADVPKINKNDDFCLNEIPMANPQKDAIEQYLLKRTSTKPLFLAVYVHGWHHNANTAENETDEGSNAIKFDYLLARIDDSLQRRKVDYEILGVYVGWRGERVKDFFPSLFSVGDRAEVADVIGRNESTLGLRKTLDHLATLMRQSNPESRMLVMGHSFGGRILSRAFMGDLKCGNAQPLGSRTIVNLVNPAVDAHTYSEAFKKPAASSEAAVPAWVNITSNDDKAAKFIYPTAHFLGLLKQENEGKTWKTIGNYTPYITHNLAVVHCANKSGNCAKLEVLRSMASATIWTSAEAARKSLVFESPGDTETEHTYCIQIARRPISVKQLDKINENSTCRYLTSGLDVEADNALRERRVPAGGRMWNIRADDALIETENPSLFGFTNHNAYVQTNWTSLLMDLIFAPENSGSVALATRPLHRDSCAIETLTARDDQL